MTTKTQAIKQAMAEVTMYRQGNGWIVSAYDHRVGCNRTSHEMSWSSARAAVTCSRALRAVAHALGHDLSDAALAAVIDPGSLRDRVNRALAAEGTHPQTGD